MAYTTPITDRTQADIAARNSKAFFNVVDWIRIYGNSSETNTVLTAALGAMASFVTISAVVNTDIPTVAEINIFLANIERMRYALKDSSVANDVDFIEIKDDYVEGQNKIAPNFINVNSWEKVIDIIYQLFKAPYTVDRAPICSVAICNAGLLRNSLIRT